jgi:hypothetical protein
MRFSRPSTGTILGATAVFIALGGTAFAAGATVVNIADPNTPANIAHVNSSGQLQTAGSTSVTNTVTTELTAPSAYVDGAVADAIGGDGCVVIATPPSGKAMIVRDVTVDVFSDPSPGEGDNLPIFTGTTCEEGGVAIGDVNPPTVGVTTLPFDPGLGVPAKSGLSAFANGSVDAEIYVDGYSVPSSQVPASTASVREGGKAWAPQQR